MCDCSSRDEENNDVLKSGHSRDEITFMMQVNESFLNLKIKIDKNRLRFFSWFGFLIVHKGILCSSRTEGSRE